QLGRPRHRARGAELRRGRGLDRCRGRAEAWLRLAALRPAHRARAHRARRIDHRQGDRPGGRAPAARARAQRLPPHRGLLRLRARVSLPAIAPPLVVALVAGIAPCAANAQAATAALDAVTVSATRPEAAALGLPVTLDAVGNETIERHGVGLELPRLLGPVPGIVVRDRYNDAQDRSEEHTSELQSRENLVC